MSELIKTLRSNPGAMRKALTAVVGALLIAVSQGLLPSAVGDWTAVVVSALTAAGVYVLPNTKVRLVHTNE